MSEQTKKNQWKFAFFVLIGVSMVSIGIMMFLANAFTADQVASAYSSSGKQLASAASQISNLTAVAKIAQQKGTPQADAKSRIVEAYALEAYFCSKQPVQNQLYSDGHAKMEGSLIHAYLFCGTSDGKSGHGYELTFDELTNQMQLYGPGVQ